MRKTFFINKLSSKWLNLLVVMVFLLSDTGFARELRPMLTVQKTVDPVSSEDVAGMAINPLHGTIREKYEGSSGRAIIHIQDAHCNYEVQMNTARMLEYLAGEKDVAFVAVEGAEGVVDTSWFDVFPEGAAKLRTTDHFVAQGQLTGVEYLSITGGQNFTVYGAEERQIYMKNLYSFLEGYRQRQVFDTYYGRVREALSTLKKHIYTDELKELDSKIIAYEERKIAFADYVGFLREVALSRDINLDSFLNLSLLHEILEKEKRIDFDIVNDEREALIEELGKSVSLEELSILMRKGADFKAGRITAGDFYSYLTDLATANGVGFSPEYSNLKEYITYAEIYAKINIESLFKEIDQKVALIKESMFVNDRQRELDKLWKNISIMFGFVDIELLNEDYEYYLANRDEFEPSVFLSFIERESEKTGSGIYLERPDKKVMEVFGKLVVFYETALERDRVMVENTLREMEDRNFDVGVLIAGGFHSEGITRMLRDRGVSYIVVTPAMTKDIKSPYMDILVGKEMDMLAGREIFSERPAMMPAYNLAIYLMSELLVNKIEGALPELRGVREFKKLWVEKFIAEWVNDVRMDFQARGQEFPDGDTLGKMFSDSVRMAISRVNRDRPQPVISAEEESYIIGRAIGLITAQKPGLSGDPQTTDIPPVDKKAPGTPAVTADEMDRIERSFLKAVYEAISSATDIDTRGFRGSRTSKEESSFALNLNRIAELYDKSAPEEKDRVGEAIKAAIRTNAETAPIFTRGVLAKALEKMDQRYRQTMEKLIRGVVSDAEKNKKVVTLIPVGGRGASFAPFSWAVLKPFTRLFEKSNVMYAVERAMATGRDPKDIFFIIERDMIETAKNELLEADIQIPDENFIPEDKGVSKKDKETVLEKTALFGFAAVYISAMRSPDTVIVAERSDLVLDAEVPGVMDAFGAALSRAETVAFLEPTIAVLGNPPLKAEVDEIMAGRKAPDPNKGYIAVNSEVDTLIDEVSSVLSFHEKPSLESGAPDNETMKQYLRDGASYNGSLFVFRADQMKRMFQYLRPEDYEQLVKLDQAQFMPEDIKEEVTRASYDYFVSDAGEKDPKIHTAFEKSVVQAFAPVGAPGVAGVADFGVAVTSMGQDIAQEWVGGQGTLRAVWGRERVEDSKENRGNHIRGPKEAYTQNVHLTDVSRSNILLNEEDKETQMHVFGVEDMAIAYEKDKNALTVVPLKMAKQVKKITEKVRGNPDIAAFAEPEQKTLPVRPRTEAKRLEAGGNSLEILGNNGFAVTLDSKNSVVYSEDGMVGIVGLDQTIVISRIEDGVRHVYVYGTDALYEGMVKLAEISPYAEASRERLAEIRKKINERTMTKEQSRTYAEEIAGSREQFEAGKIEGSFRKCYAEMGGILRDDVEALTLLITHEDNEIAEAAYPSWLYGIGNWLSDFHAPKEMMAHDAVMAQTLEVARKTPGEHWEKLDKNLNEYGLVDEETMRKLHAELGKIRSLRERGILDRKAIKTVVVISRLKPGGDVAMNSVIFAKIKKALPDARIVFVGPATISDLYGGDEDIDIVTFKREKEKTFLGRVLNARKTREIVSGKLNDLKKGEEALVFDISVRDTHYGVFPALPADIALRNYIYYEEVTEGETTLSEEIDDWMYKIFDIDEGTPFEPNYSNLAVPAEAENKATEILSSVGFKEGNYVTLTFGTGGDSSKQISVEFEAALVKGLLEKGRNVVISKGDPREVGRVDEIVNKLSEMGISVEHVDEKDIRSLPATYPRVITVSAGLGVFTSLIGKSGQLICYSSAPKHFGGALRIPTVVVYLRDSEAVDKWVPYTPTPVDVWRISPEEADKAVQQELADIVVARAIRQMQLVATPSEIPKRTASFEEQKQVVGEVAQAFGANLTEYTTSKCTVFVQQGMSLRGRSVRRYIEGVYGRDVANNLRILEFVSLDQIATRIPEHPHAVIAFRSELAKYNETVPGWEDIKNILANTPILTVADVDLERGMDLMYRTELLAAGIVAAHTTDQDIADQNVRAQSLLRIVRVLSGDSSLTFDSLRGLIKAEDITVEAVLKRLGLLINELLLDMPVQRADLDARLNNERRIAWAA